MFVCTLGNGQDTFSANRLDGEGETIIIIPIGHFEDSGHTVSAVVVLASIPGYGDGTKRELVFRLVEMGPNNAHIRDYYDGFETKSFLSSPADREQVRACVGGAVELLIDQIQPEAVEMMTYTANLPKSALSKYQDIAHIFAAKGYQVARPDSYHNRWIWMMRRP